MSFGAITRYQAAKLEQMEWATSDPCDACKQNRGQVIDIGGTFKSGATMPPAHPHCRCALLPVIPEFEPNANGVVDIAPKPETYREFTDSQQSFEFSKYQMQNKTFAKVVSKEEVYGAIDAYKGADYNVINTYLRTGKVQLQPGAEAPVLKIKEIDKAMKVAPGLPEPVLSFRGLNSVESDPLDQMFSAMRPGDSWVDKGYSSTTLNREFAETFADGWLITVENPAGTKGVMIDGLFDYPGVKEQEWLLPRGTDFEVISVDAIDKNMTVRVKQ
jgi:hypothetical protein